MATSQENMDTEECDDRDLAKQIIKILNHTSESLEEVELAKFLKLVDRLGKEEMGEDDVKRLVLNCTEMTLFKEGMTVHLTKQTVRSLIAINQDFKLWQAVWKDISRLAGPLIFSILADHKEIDAVTLEKYMDLLQHGTEKVRHIRLMVVGMFGVGKTTIIRRLCNQDTSSVETTVGIDVSVNACEIDSRKEWNVRDLSANSDKYYKQRMSSGYHHRVSVKREKESHEKQQMEQLHVIEEERPTSGKPAEANQKHNEVDDQQSEIPEHHKTKDVTQILPRPKPGVSWQKMAENQDPKTQKFFSDVNKAINDENEFEYEERLTTVSIWDFAGQSIYYSTHHFFLSARAIYLLVLDISRNLSEKVPEDNLCSGNRNRATSMPIGFTCLDAFKFWMNSIYTYTAARKDEKLKDYKPTIVLVGTFKDKVIEKFPQKSKQDGWLENYKEDYFNDALRSLKGAEVLRLVHRKKFFVSRDDPVEIFNELKSALTSVAEEQPFWDEIVPMSWIPLERSIEGRKGETITTETGKQNKNCAIMDLHELETIDQETEYPLSDKKLIKLFLNFQHALGNVLYYDAVKLEDNIILDPQWILDVFKLFVTHVRDKEPTMLDEWDTYEENAILTQRLIDELIKHGGRESFQKYKGEIIHYMEYLDVIAKPVSFEKSHEDNSFSEDEDGDEDNMKNVRWPICQQENFYIVPCLLSQRPEEELGRKNQGGPKVTPILCFIFKNNFLPAFVCHRLIATCIRKWEVDIFNGKRILFKGFGRFNLDQTSNTKLDLWWKDHILYMRIFRYSEQGKSVNKSMCSRVRKGIRNMIQQIFSIHQNITGQSTKNDNIHYDEYIKCPRCHEETELSKQGGGAGSTLLSNMFEVETFKKSEEMTCSRYHTVSQEEALSYWFNKESQEYLMEIVYKSREGVKEYLKEIPSESEVEDRHLAELSEGIGKEYVVLGIELKLPFEKIQRIETDEPDIRTRIKNVLFEWKRTCPETPTIAIFKSAFEKIAGFRFKDRGDRAIDIVKWFEKRENLTESPNERELIEVTQLVGRRYKRLAEILLETHLHKYAVIEQIEMQYSLDFIRTLVILLKWRNEAKHVTFTFLKDCLVKMFRINWEVTKKKIAEYEEAKRAAERREGTFPFHTQLPREREDPTNEDGAGW